MNFQFVVHTTWPALAWVAEGTFGNSVLQVHHGRHVETADDWFGEIVWDADFSQAHFDQSDLVFGSGAKRRDDEVCFVSASHTMDRLVWCVDGGRFWVSNSLPALLARSETEIDASYPDYPRDFQSMILGLSSYRRDLANASRNVQLLYHDNLRLDLKSLTPVPKPVIPRELTSYDAYRNFLVQSLKRCASNLRDSRRQFRFDWLGTLSTGFDSPTVCALAREAGLTEALTMTSARGGVSDSGDEIGNRLDLVLHRLDRSGWQQAELPEVPFLSADAKGEDVYLRSAEPLTRGRVLLTGFAAGAWARRSAPLTELSRADQSGLSLTEYRLGAKFIHLPVPTMGLRSGGDIFRVNLSPEMAQWSQDREYDKPFCRRVLVEQGVPDSLFGQEKKAASVLMFDRRSFLSASSLQDFEAHYARVRSQHFWSVRRRCFATGARGLAAGSALACASILPGRWMQRVRHSVRIQETAYRDPRYDYLFAWATHHAMQRYRR